MASQISASDMDEEYMLTVQYPYRYFMKIPSNPPLYMSIIILVAFPLLIIVRRFNLPIGDRVIMLIISFFYIHIFNIDFFQSINIFIHTSPIHKVTWLLPLLQFRSLFMLELYVIKKARYEIFIMAILCNFIVVIGTTFTLAKLVLNDSSLLSCLLFSTIITCVEGCDSFRRIKQMERNKHLLIILESDALLGYTLILTCFHVVLMTYGGLLSTWQAQILFVLRYLIGGFICGIVLGKIAGWCLSRVYNDSHSALIVCLCYTYLSYSVCEYVFVVSGPIVSFIVCQYLSTARKKLTAETVLFIRHFVDVITYISTITIFVVTASRLFYRTIYYSSSRTLGYVFFSYCFMVLLRMISLLMVYPLLRRVGYKMDLASCTFYGWAGASRGPIALVLAQIAYRTNVATDSFDVAMPHVVGTVVLSIIINYSTYSLLLNKLGFYTMSTMRRGNMQNCVDYLNTRKWTLLTILKMASRLMTDTNYPIVYKYTVIKNPYRGREYKDADEDDEKLINELGLRESKCPLCNRDISLQPTIKEKTENLKEARLRLLKIQKVAFIQQYELGMLSKEALRFLLHLVEAATESIDPYIKLDEFYKILSTKGFYYRTKKMAERLYGNDAIKVPKNHLRKLCYRIVTHVVFEGFIFVLIIMVSVPFIMRYINRDLYYRQLAFYYAISTTFLIIFLMEIVIKIYAFSSDGYWDGVKTYFRSKWNMLDFFVVAVHLFSVVFIAIARKITFMNVYRSIIISFNGVVKLLRLFRLLRVISVSWIAKCNQKINSQILFGYDVGKAIIITYSDLADSLYQITENSENVFIIKGQLDKDRDNVNISLENVIKLQPSVPVQVKTRQAIKSTLNHLRATTIELKNLGYVDNLEFDQIMSRLYERNKAAKSLGKIKPNSPRALFMQLPFIAADDPVTYLLFSQLEIINWEPNILIVDNSDDALGIFILLQGVLRITYLPNQRVVDDLIKYGMLPIVDFVSPFRADVPVEEFIFPGNSFGELAVLTQRKYNCRIQTDTKCRALFLSADKILEALKISCDPVQGLGTRLWKSVIIDFATGILRTTPGYQNNSLDQIRMTIDRSFVPNLQHYKTFIVTDLIEDLLLLEGLVADIGNGDVYVAPCYLPRTVQKLVLCSDEEYNMHVKVIPKLLIIPMKDVDEYEIMERVEDMVDLIDNTPDYLLVHKYRKKRLKNKKKGGGGGGLIGLSKRRRFIDSTITKSRSRTLSLNSSIKSDPSLRSESVSQKSSGETEFDEVSYESGSSPHGSVAPNRVTYLIPEDFDDYVAKSTAEDGSIKTTKESDVEIQNTLSSIVAPILENLMEDIFYGIENKNNKTTLKRTYSWEVDNLDNISLYSYQQNVKVDEGKKRKKFGWFDRKKSTGDNESIASKLENVSAKKIESITEIDTTEQDAEGGKQLDVFISTEDYLKGIIENIVDIALVASENVMDKEVSGTLDLQELGSIYSAPGFTEAEDVESDRYIVQIIIKDLLSDSNLMPGNINSVESKFSEELIHEKNQIIQDKTNDSLTSELLDSLGKDLRISADEKDKIRSDRDAEIFRKVKKINDASKKLEKLDSEDGPIKKNTEMLELSLSQNSAHLSEASSIAFTIHIPSNSKEELAHFETKATVHQEKIEEKSTELFNMNQKSLDGDVNRRSSTSNQSNEQPIDRVTETMKNGSRNKNDKERKKKEKEANRKDEREHEAEQSSQGESSKINVKHPRSSNVHETKIIEIDPKAAIKKFIDVKDRKSMVVPSNVSLPTHVVSTITPELEVSQKHLDEQITKMQVEKEQNKLPERTKESIGSLSFNTDLDLQRKFFMRKIKAANEYQDSQEHLSPSYEELSKSKRKRESNEDETSRSKQKDSDVKSNSRKFDRSVEKIVTEYKLKAKRAGSIEEEAKSDNEEQRNTKNTSLMDKATAKRKASSNSNSITQSPNVSKSNEFTKDGHSLYVPEDQQKKDRSLSKDLDDIELKDDNGLVADDALPGPSQQKTESDTNTGAP